MSNEETLKNTEAGSSTRAFLLVIVLLLIIIAGFLVVPALQNSATGSAVVPPQNVKIMSQLPDADCGLLTKSDVGVYDYRQWKPVPDNKILKERVSPMNYTNYLRVMKTSECSHLYAHYGTSGYAIDLNCVTHPYNVLGSQATLIHTRQVDKQYVIDVDISKEPVNVEFSVIIQGTYWNGESTEGVGSVDTYTEKDPMPDILSMVVLFPSKKPCTGISKLDETTNDTIWKVYPDLSEAFLGKEGTSIYWEIRKKSPETHYRLSWAW